MWVWMPARVERLPRLDLEEELLDQLVDLMEDVCGKLYIKGNWEKWGGWAEMGPAAMRRKGECEGDEGGGGEFREMRV
jgi:hypothetical protein